MTEGFNKLPLMRELSAQLTEGEKSLTRFDIPSGNLFWNPSVFSVINHRKSTSL